MSQSRLEKIRAALAANKGGTTQTDVPKIKEITWKPKVGENDVRLVFPPNQDLPYYLVKYYDFKVLAPYPILSPNSFGGYTADPIQNTCYELRKKDSTQEDKELASKFRTNQKFFFPVIVRDEQEKGVQMWDVPVNKVEMVMNLFSEKSADEYGDVSDETEGRDLRITCTDTIIPNSKPQRSYPEIISVAPRVKQTVLGTDDQIELWTSNIPDVYSYFQKKDDSELIKLFEKKVQEMLGNYEEQEEQEEESEETSAPKVEAPKETVVKETISKGKSAPKLAKSVDEELEDFDKMFEEKE